MASEDYKESEMSKIVKRLMDEEGFEFGEAVKEAMEQTKNFESKADGGAIGIEVLFKEKMKDGGRAGFFMGGPALEGEALSIYNSMKAYGNDDQAIADKLQSLGYYDPNASTTSDNIIGSQINQGGEGQPIRPTSQIVSNFSETIEDRQNKLNKPNMIAKFVDKFIPQQRSIADMLASGQVDRRVTSGIPLGISGLIAKALPDNYYDNMTLGDQITTQAYMGYTDPNTNMANKDPFGLNVRSMFGNYAEKAAELVGTLEAKLARIGELSEYDQARLDHYKNVTKTKQDATADIGLINLAKKREADRQAALQKKEAAARIAKANIAATPGFDVSGGAGGSYDRGRDYSGRSDKTAGDRARTRDARKSDLGFSDIRLKENVELIGKSPSNINIYKFNYKDNPTTYQGAMAHEVPWASVKHSNGYMMIDYNKIDVEFKLYDVH